MRTLMLAAAAFTLPALPLPSALSLVPTARAQAETDAAAPPRPQRTIVCRGAAIPAGWILVDDTRDSSMCGGENPSVVRLYNVWAIERYDLQPVGAVIEVCAAAPTPAGWELVDVYRDKSRCGHPPENFIVNVKRIRRVD
ncbi:MAG: hypothetical protein ACRENI_01255 [Gemmatimonadaceae bacterium]